LRVKISTNEEVRRTKYKVRLVSAFLITDCFANTTEEPSSASPAALPSAVERGWGLGVRRVG
jgi:hypothetical protein